MNEWGFNAVLLTGLGLGCLGFDLLEQSDDEPYCSRQSAAADAKAGAGAEGLDVLMSMSWCFVCQ